MSGNRIIVGDGPLTIEDVVRATRDPSGYLEFSARPEFREQVERSVRHLERRRLGKDVIYGVTTGVGDSCVRPVPAALADEFSRQLTRMHGCGLGRHFEPEIVGAVLVVQLNSLARGYSAVRFEVLDRLRQMFNHRMLPLIPEEGSVGASGDLTPLSYVAAAVMGERRVWFRGGEMDAGEALGLLGWEAMSLRPKEGLALINGTAVMTAAACLAWDRARHLLALSTRLAALLSEVLRGNKGHFDPRLFDAKPHPGQRQVAARMARDLGWTAEYSHGAEDRIQDTYALRCAPHVLGVLNDALPWMRQFLETELNGVNDNPLIDPETGDVMHGGNFYGGHVAFAMDGLKNAVANVADLLDRQMALLVNEKRNRGLPLNLSGAAPERLPVNHGFKAVQIACSAWAAEALKQTMPASVFSRSTESHNQDKVSMGTIAARDALRVIELTEQVLAAVMLGGAQAWDLRARESRPAGEALSSELGDFTRTIRTYSAFVEEDRPLEGDLRALLNAIRRRDIQVEL